MLERVKPVLFMLGQILLDILPENYKQESWTIIINHSNECVPVSVGIKKIYSYYILGKSLNINSSVNAMSITKSYRVKC